MRFLGTGRALPLRALTSIELDRIHGLQDGYLESVCGVSRRYFCEAESQIDLAVMASLAALEEAGLSPGDIDVIISAAAVPYQPIPATAPAIQLALGIEDGACFATDINSTCLGFPVALHFANGLLMGAPNQKILIVSSEIASRGLPWETQPDVAGLFGDGAGAAIITGSEQSSLIASHFVTLPSAYEACTIGAGGTRFDFDKEKELFATHSKFSMDGKELYRVTAKRFAPFVDTLLDRGNMKLADIDHILPHQASPAGLAHMIRLCKMQPEKVSNIAAEHGNQIAASLPFVLDHARKNGTIGKGSRVMMLGTSAGVSFGGLILEL